jgi:hypothetical protein
VKGNGALVAAAVYEEHEPKEVFPLRNDDNTASKMHQPPSFKY